MATVDSYVGVYELSPRVTMTIARTAAGLVADATVQGKTLLDAESESEFTAQIVAARITFERDASGSVVGLRLEQRGQAVYARRVS